MRGDKGSDPSRGRHERSRGSVRDNVKVLIEEIEFRVIHMTERNVCANQGDESGVSNFGLLSQKRKIELDMFYKAEW